MSVINDMLRDLNQRRAPEVAGARAPVPQSLIEPQKNTLRTLLVVLVFVLCTAAVTAYWLMSLKDSMPGGSEQASQHADGLSVVQEPHVSREQALLETPSPSDKPQQEALSVAVDMSGTVPQVSVSEANQPQMKSLTSPEDNSSPVSNVSPSDMKDTVLTVRPASSRPLAELQAEIVMEKPVQPEIKALSVTALSQTRTTDEQQPVGENPLAPENQAQQTTKETPVAMQVSLSPAARDRQMAEQALKLFSSGHSDQAYRELVEFLEGAEVDNASRAVLANYLLQENRLAEAGDLLLNAPIQSSTSLRQLKARWYAALGDEKMALYTLNSELPEIKQYPDYYVLLAAYYQRFGWHKEALKTYTALVEYDDSVADWWAGLALAADRTQDFKQAALAYELALELPGLTPELSSFIKNRLKQLRAVQRNS